MKKKRAAVIEAIQKPINTIKPHAWPEIMPMATYKKRSETAMQPVSSYISFRRKPQNGVDITAELCGDPPPGRSALDMKRAGQ